MTWAGFVFLEALAAAILAYTIHESRNVSVWTTNEIAGGIGITLGFILVHVSACIWLATARLRQHYTTEVNNRLSLAEERLKNAMDVLPDKLKGATADIRVENQRATQGQITDFNALRASAVDSANAVAQARVDDLVARMQEFHKTMGATVAEHAFTARQAAENTHAGACAQRSVKFLIEALEARGWKIHYNGNEITAIDPPKDPPS